MSKTIHEQIAEEAGIGACRVQCDTCGAVLSVDGAACLRDGWPRCCGYTMRLLPREASHA